MWHLPERQKHTNFDLIILIFSRFSIYLKLRIFYPNVTLKIYIIFYIHQIPPLPAPVNNVHHSMCHLLFFSTFDSVYCLHLIINKVRTEIFLVPILVWTLRGINCVRDFRSIALIFADLKVLAAVRLWLLRPSLKCRLYSANRFFLSETFLPLQKYFVFTNDVLMKGKTLMQ